MDDGNERPRHPNTSCNLRNDSRPRPDATSQDGRSSGGLLSRYGNGRAQGDAGSGGARQSPPPQPSAPPPSYTPPTPPSSGGGAGWRRYDPNAGQWSEAPGSANDSPSYSPGSGSGDASAQRGPYATPLNDRLAQRPSRERDDASADDGVRGAWRAFTGQARRIGDGVRKRITDGIRTPRAGEWRASDFDPDTLEEWDQNDSAPFELPTDPDDESRKYRAPQPTRRDERSGPSRNSAGRDARPATTPYRGGLGSRDARGGPRGWEDNGWEDAGWETGTWDTGWATDYQSSVDYGEDGGDSGFWAPSRGAAYDDEDDDAISQSLS
ncbi:MAG: hypothetical protein ACXVDI_24610, partial [Ktedonobacterales bacterium]